MEVEFMADGSMQFDALLDEYRRIWNNRLLNTNGRTSEETLLEAVKREILDENSHPRTRKSKFEKYYFAITRILNSGISAEAKVSLIQVHNVVIDELMKE